MSFLINWWFYCLVCLFLFNLPHFGTLSINRMLPGSFHSNRLSFALFSIFTIASPISFCCCEVNIWQERSVCETLREKWNRNDVSGVLSDQLNMIFTAVLPVYGTVSYPSHFLHLCSLWIFNAWPCVKSLWSALVCGVWVVMPAEVFTEGLRCTSFL